jgi:hypothetical protein
MSGRQAALPTEGTGTRITLICTSRTIAATRRDLRQIGGYVRASTMERCHTK